MVNTLCWLACLLRLMEVHVGQDILSELYNSFWAY